MNWARIAGYPEYAVSTDGQVLSIRTGQFRVLTPMEKGYLKVNLTGEDGKQHTRKVGRLVAVHHIPNPENKPQVNHKDRVKANNSVTNLEWATHMENVNHWRGIK